MDGLNILRRVYGAIPGDDSREKAEGAVRSSIGTVKRLLKVHQPTHTVMAFDHGGETFRHRMYPAYHEGRKPMPEPLRDQLPNMVELLQQLGILSLSVPDVEADDVLATISTKYVQSGRGLAVVSTTDKDLAQLISAGVRIYDQFADAFVTEEQLLKKFCVKSDRLGDCLALMSDTVDGIPGVPDVGPVTAGKWLAEYGDLDGVLANAQAIKGVRGQRLRDNLENVILSRKLVTLKTDVVLNLTWNRIVYPPATA